MLQNALLEKRGPFLREICIIDEHLKSMNFGKDMSPSPKSWSKCFLFFLQSCLLL